MPFAFLAFLVSASAVTASLYLSLGLEFKACTLCFYQRAFACGLVAVLASGLFAFREQTARLCLVALPLAIAGLGVAGFQVWLGSTDWPRAEATWYLACPAGLLGYGTVPQQSLAAFALISVLLIGGGLREVAASRQCASALLVALVLGACAAMASIIANPPLQDLKPIPGKPLTTCLPTSR